MSFTDVSPDDYFYTAVRYLYCAGVVSGYSDNTFRPYNNTTRAQLSKIIVLAEGWTDPCPSTGHCTDVPPSNPFFCFIETAYAHGVISGYADGTFLPGNNITRGQLSKVVVLAEGWTDPCPTVGHFTDVPPGSTFYSYATCLACQGIISGYQCGGNGEPCGPGNNPYCHHRAIERDRQGLRERLVMREPAPGEPFDHGTFELILEPK